MAFTPLPDATQELITFLAAHASLSPLHGGRVGTKVQTDLPCLQVTALGGPQPWPWESAPEFQLASWGGTSDAGEGEAWALDLAVRAAVFDTGRARGQPHHIRAFLRRITTTGS